MQKSTQIERLSKVIARNTSYSRRQAEKLIDEGRVSVDGKKIISQGMNVSKNNKIFVDKKCGSSGLCASSRRNTAKRQASGATEGDTGALCFPVRKPSTGTTAIAAVTV